LNSSQLSSRLK